MTPTSISDLEKGKVAVTGMGAISSIGNNTDEFFKSLLAGKCGIEKVTQEDYPLHHFRENDPFLAGRIKNFETSSYFSKEECNHFDYPSLVVLKAVEEAVKDSAFLVNECNVSVICGSAVGLRPPYNRLNSSFSVYASSKRKSLETEYYSALPMEFMMDTVLGAISKKFNLEGTGLCMSTICASGATAVCFGRDLIMNRQSDVVICIGFDHYHPRQSTVFSNFKMLTGDKCAPFDESSKGFQLAEGAGVVVLESLDKAKERKAHIYAEILGTAITNDAYHIVIPSPSGKEYAKAIELSIRDANIEPEDVDFISLMGRGSKLSDLKELEGVRRIFGDLLKEIPINSITSYTGYSLGASSMLNFISTLIQMKEKIILPILNFKKPLSRYKFNFVKEKIEKEFNTALICSHAFTGVNTAIIIKKHE